MQMTSHVWITVQPMGVLQMTDFSGSPTNTLLTLHTGSTHWLKIAFACDIVVFLCSFRFHLTVHIFDGLGPVGQEQHMGWSPRFEDGLIDDEWEVHMHLQPAA